MCSSHAPMGSDVQVAREDNSMMTERGVHALGQAFDMAYMLNGKFAVKHDPTLTGHNTGNYL
jgi:hypothetical protein